jgi:hypothetical protein
MNLCRGTKRNGEPCTLPATQGSAWCWNHDPARAEERSKNASRAASAKHSHLHGEMRELRELLWSIITLALKGRLNSRARMDMNKIIQLLQVYLRAAEIELASGKEPERGSVLPPGMLEKLQQYIADKDREGTETRASLSGMMPPVGELTTEGKLAARGEEMPGEVAEEWRQRLRAQIDQELRA